MDGVWPCFFPARKDFLFHVKALSIVFRGKFLDFLETAFDRGKLQFPGRTAPLKVPQTFKRLVKGLRQKDWVVYAKKPFSSPHKVLDSLGRYTHRVAISNNHILCAKDGEVTFSYSDRKDKDRLKTKTRYA